MSLVWGHGRSTLAPDRTRRRVPLSRGGAADREAVEAVEVGTDNPPTSGPRNTSPISSRRGGAVPAAHTTTPANRQEAR